MFLPLNQGSQVRILAEITGSQDNAKTETKTAGGIVLTGSATKEKDAKYGKIGKVVQVSDQNDELKVGDEIIVGPNSGRSAISENGRTLYVLNRDEIWAYQRP